MIKILSYKNSMYFLELRNHFLIIISILFLLSFNLKGQTHYRSNIAVGIKGGVDFSQYFFNPSVRQKMTAGGTSGVMIRYIEENHFGLIAELNFSQRGWSENFEEAPYHYRRTINYLELPILAHIYFGRSGRFFLNLGPVFSAVLGESTSANFNPEEMSTLPDFPYRNRMNTQMLLSVQNKFDYGITAGIGAEYNISSRNSLFAEFRFYYGLGNIFKSRRTDPFNSSNAMTLSATLGYWFRLK